MKDFQERLDTLLAIFSIPLEEEWEDSLLENGYTVYHYWKNLGLITQKELTELFREKSLKSNPILARYFKNLDYHFKPKYYQNGQVADIGSGFGFITLWLILSGANKVYSIGDPERISYIDRLYKRAIEKRLISAEKLSLKPEFIKVGDSALARDISPQSIDLVLLNDTLEHITPRIFPSLVKSSYNSLKKNGLFIARQQNTDSPKMLASLEKVWEEDDKKIFQKQRLDIINKTTTGIPESEKLELARRTRGLDSVDFYQAIDNYLKHKTFPTHDTNIAPIDVEIDVPHEGDTGIKRICQEFERNGFRKVSVYPDFLPSKRSSFMQPLAKLFPFLFLSLHLFDDKSVFWVRK